MLLYYHYFGDYVKSFFKNNYKSFPKTLIMLRCTLIFALSVIICSSLSFYLAEHTSYYYDMRVLSFELITVLRSGVAMLTAGTAIMANIERQEKRSN